MQSQTIPGAHFAAVTQPPSGVHSVACDAQRTLPYNTDVSRPDPGLIINPQPQARWTANGSAKQAHAALPANQPHAHQKANAKAPTS
jgi:hypothetical protein